MGVSVFDFMAKNWRTIASWILWFTKIGLYEQDTGQKRSDILGKCAAYSSDSTVSTNPFWLVSQFYRSILLVFFITMAVLWLFCPEIRRVCIFSSPLDGRCHSQLKLEFQGFPGVEWWAPFQFLLSSVLLLLWHYKAMRAFLLLSTIALVALHKKVHTLLLFRVKSQPLTFKVSQTP